MGVIWIKNSGILNIKIRLPPVKKETYSERLWLYELGKGKVSEICWLHGEEIFQEGENIPSGPCASSVVSPVQASQAAQEAEINARKAKNSVTSLLNLVNDLLEQLGE